MAADGVIHSVKNDGTSGKSVLVWFLPSSPCVGVLPRVRSVLIEEKEEEEGVEDEERVQSHSSTTMGGCVVQKGRPSYGKRLRVAFLLIPVLLIGNAVSHLVITLVCSVLAFVGVDEARAIVHRALVTSAAPPLDVPPERWRRTFTSSLGSLVTLSAAWGQHSLVLLSTLMGIMLLGLRGIVEGSRHTPDAHLAVLLVCDVFALACVAVPLACILLVRTAVYEVEGAGAGWLVVMLAVSWIADTGALIVGSCCGRHALLPSISPRKTWEGVGASFLSGVLASWVLGILRKRDFSVAVLLLPNAPWEQYLIIGSMMACGGVLGDLFVSLLKRLGGVKDSGRFFGVHGGVLDRIDSIMLPAVWVHGFLRWSERFH